MIVDIEKAICNLKENIEMPFGIDISKETSKMIIESLEELQQYRQIGTVDECMIAKEKTNPLQPKVNKVRKPHKCDRSLEEIKNRKRIRLIQKCKIYVKGFLFPDGAFVEFNDPSEEYDYYDDNLIERLKKQGVLYIDSNAVIWDDKMSLTDQQREYLSNHMEYFNKRQNEAFRKLMKKEVIYRFINQNLFFSDQEQDVGLKVIEQCLPNCKVAGEKNEKHLLCKWGYRIEEDEEGFLFPNGHFLEYCISSDADISLDANIRFSSCDSYDNLIDFMKNHGVLYIGSSQLIWNNTMILSDKQQEFIADHMNGFNTYQRKELLNLQTKSRLFSHIKALDKIEE